MNKKKKNRVIISILSLFIICFIILYCISSSIYKDSFDYRCTTSDEIALNINDFPNMKSERHTFKSNKGQILVGYLYENVDETIDEKGVIVFAHGLGGGGQRVYLSIFDILIQNNYYVFAYDATANDESEGKIIGGLPQGYIDLDYAITYAQSIDKIASLPFVLMGYSWGGFSVTNVLNYHPEVKAVCSLAGWDKSMDLIDYHFLEKAGKFDKVLLPFASLYEFFKYGKYSFSTSMKGFKNSDCGVLIIHSSDDIAIPIELGYDMYFEKYKNDDRFEFIKYDNRNHGVLTENGSLDIELINQIITFFNKYISIE